MLKNRGAALALAGLIVLPVIGLSFFDRPHCYENHEGCVAHYNQRAKKDQFSLFFVMGAWGAANRDAIDAWGVFGSLIFAGALVWATATLTAKTSGLYRETAALRAIADRQRADMLRSIKAAENSADAAQKSINFAESAFIASKRAWLSIGSLKIIHPTEISENGARIRVSFTVRNHGETHATNVWLDSIHWLSTGGETYAVAFEKFMSTMRNHITTGAPGPIIFAKAVEDVAVMWFIDADIIKKAIRIRDTDGQKFLDFSLFVAISYKIEGDSAPHLTFIPYDWLNVPIGFKLAEGEFKEKAPAAFGSSIAD